MRRYLFGPLVFVTDCFIMLTVLMISFLGLARFFLITGANPRYIKNRKLWYETSMIGTTMKFNHYISFGLWACSPTVYHTLRES